MATISIGRSRSNSLVLSESDAPASSGQHAELVCESGRWVLRDRASTNGTFLNGRRVERAAVGSGDLITIGSTELSIRVLASRWHVWMARSMSASAAVGLLAFGLWWQFVRPASPQQIASAASRSVFLIALDRPGARAVVGTAFAIASEGLLATNAHVAQAVEEARAADRHETALAVRGDTYDVSAIDTVYLHPRWRAGSIANDVAVIRLSGRPDLTPLTLASASDVRSLRRGVGLAAFGFPASSTDAVRPRGRLSVDVLSDVRLPYLEVGLSVAPGTSGSPVFGPKGSVVAMVVAGDFVGEPENAFGRPSRSAANWAISVEVLKALLDDLSGRSSDAP